MKKILILFCFTLILFLVTVEAKGNSSEKLTEEVLVKIDFQNRGVTTKNIDQKLSNISYKLQGGKVKINLRYQDETIENQLEALKVRNFEKIEREYQEILTKFSLEEDLEKAKRVGTPLKEVILLIHQKDYQKLKEEGFSISVI